MWGINIAATIVICWWIGLMKRICIATPLVIIGDRFYLGSLVENYVTLGSRFEHVGCIGNWDRM